MQKKALRQFSVDNILLIILLIFGTVSWSLTMVKSGIIYSFGMGFWGANGHDGVWHIALINSLSKNLTNLQSGFPMPIFSGSNIKNYHLGFDLIVAFIHNATNISVISLYFQIIPPILALLIGISAYLFVKKLTNSSKSALISTFFVYFAGDLSWILGKGESTFWSQQSISTLINPPFALSLIFIFFGLYFLLKRNYILSTIFLGLLLETKAYAGVLILGGLFLGGLWQIVKEKKFNLITVFIGSSVLTGILFLLFNKNSENVFVFSPFWYLQNLFTQDRLNIAKFSSAISNYNLAGNWLKLIPAYALSFAIFWVGNMWTRLFKEFEILKWVRKPKSVTPINLFFLSVIISGAVIPMFFVQKGTPWNTIQFFYYSLIFSGILAGISVSKIKSNLAVLFVLALTLPTTLITLKDVYIPARPPAKISNNELAALNFLSKLPVGTVLTYPFDQAKADEAINNPPRSLYLYTSTAYVSAFSNHPAFLEDEINLDITNFDWKVRRELALNFFNSKDQKAANTFLKDNKITYIYLLNSQKTFLKEGQPNLNKIYSNSEVVIYKIE